MQDCGYLTVTRYTGATFWQYVQFHKLHVTDRLSSAKYMRNDKFSIICKEEYFYHMPSTICLNPLNRAPWRFVMVPSDNRDHFVFMDMNQDGLVSLNEYNLVHRVFGYLRYDIKDEHNFLYDT